MDHRTSLIVATALRKMFTKGYIDICTINECLSLANIVPIGRSIKELHTLHCVHFKDMPEELLKELPEMLRQCFAGIQVDFIMEMALPKGQTEVALPWRNLQ